MPPGTTPAAEAQVKAVPALRCASLILCGGFQYLGRCYQTLVTAQETGGQRGTGESREHYLYFERDDSPGNITWVLFGVHDQPAANGRSVRCSL
ncbi:MAG: hypothetical protein RLZZ387_611 [Chloroflexota bacterium]